MKVVHKAEAATKQSLLAKARNAEERNELQEAADAYEQLINKDRLNESAYNRLFITYRKLKEYQKELDAIDTGIAAFEKHYASRHDKRPAEVNAISRKLSKALGLMDKKGNSLYSPEPLPKWRKRREAVEKKVKSMKKK